MKRLGFFFGITCLILCSCASQTVRKDSVRKDWSRDYITTDGKLGCGVSELGICLSSESQPNCDSVRLALYNGYRVKIDGPYSINLKFIATDIVEPVFRLEMDPEQCTQLVNTIFCRRAKLILRGRENYMKKLPCWKSCFISSNIDDEETRLSIFE